MSKFHILGYPRIGAKRELKFALESYWKGLTDEEQLQTVATDIRAKNWQVQKDNGAKFITVGDFSFYDHVLDTLVCVGGIPARFGFNPQTLSLEQYFQLARGNKTQFAMEMTKWFDTNYHYIVPEWFSNTTFSLNAHHLLAQIEQAKTLSTSIKPVIVGPLTLLYLGKEKEEGFNRLELLEKLLPVYQDLLDVLAQQGITWIQIDEPILALDLNKDWLAAFATTYETLQHQHLSLLLSTYFCDITEHTALLQNLPIQGLHIDCVRAPEQLAHFVECWPTNKVLSLGIVDGRNVWRANLRHILDNVAPAQAKFGENLWLAPSCSLLHSPQDLNVEEKLDTTVKTWLAFAQQKVEELSVLNKALNLGEDSVSHELFISYAAAEDRKTNKRIHQQAVKERLAQLPEGVDKRKSSFATRIAAQQAWLNLPLLPTTTIGSFPQTSEIRQARATYKKGELSLEAYEAAMKQEIAHVVAIQEELDIDVLVHGEAERNDMVEYFGEQLSGFVFTQFAWVQSYGSRCVKPPIIFGDVSRPAPMTVKWSSYAQSLTQRPMKGMLTGPVTILQWSFVRDDIPRREVCQQIALALNDEVLDLEKAGIKIIQIDEPAIREGLPLKRKDWDSYLQWACHAFRLSAGGVADETQIHTHMCYSEFNDILPAIASLDADVITIETSRSDMELLKAFSDFNYPNDIGPGVYDIHSPRIPTAKEITHLLTKALEVVPAQRLWVNPDCGLKTRAWPETIEALKVMVDVTKKLRQQLTA